MLFTKLTVLLLLLPFVMGHFKYAPRIIKGNNASEGQFPFMASLRDSFKMLHLCSGVIISSQWVLTSGHCIKPKIAENEYEVYVGSVDKYDKGSVYPVAQIFVHPQFKATPIHLYNDLAALRLFKALVLSPSVAPIALEAIQDKSGIVVVEVGWGQIFPDRVVKNRMLRHLVLTTVETEKCQSVHAVANNMVDGERQICAISREGGSPCHGDSGGPLISGKSGRLVGIFSSMENCRGDFPALFVRVEAYVMWIENITELSFPLV